MIDEILKMEKSPMEELEIAVTQRDARRLLSKEDYEALELFEESKRRGFPFYPFAVSEYHRLLDELRDKKRKEYAKMMAGEYEKKVKEDEIKLKKLSEGTALSTRKEAVEFFIRGFPSTKRLLDRSDPTNWLSETPLKIIEAAQGCVEGLFDYLMSEVENPDAFGYKRNIWPVAVPHLNYVKAGVDSLEFCFDPYAVSTIKVHRVEHKKKFYGWIYTYPSSDESLYIFTEILDPQTLDITLPKITVPLKLLLGLASGDLQPDGCEVTKQEGGILTYRIEGFDAEVVLPQDFVTFLMELGEEPLKRLQELGLLSEITLKILESKKREEKPTELPAIREKDRKYLGIIHKTEGFLTFGGWGESLGLTKQGADSLLKRLEAEGTVSTIKHESGEGIKASLTDLGLAALRQIPEFDA